MTNDRVDTLLKRLAGISAEAERRLHGETDPERRMEIIRQTQREERRLRARKRAGVSGEGAAADSSEDGASGPQKPLWPLRPYRVYGQSLAERERAKADWIAKHGPLPRRRP